MVAGRNAAWRPGPYAVTFQRSARGVILTRELDHDGAQQRQRDQVWQCHHCVKRVGNQPDQIDSSASTTFKGQCPRSDEHSGNPDDPIGFDRLHTKDVLPALLTVVTLSENGREGKDCQ